MHRFTRTVFVPVQVAEHDLELFFVGVEILGELLKVQHSILVGVSIFYDLKHFFFQLSMSDWKTKAEERCIVRIIKNYEVQIANHLCLVNNRYRLGLGSQS